MSLGVSPREGMYGVTSVGGGGQRRSELDVLMSIALPLLRGLGGGRALTLHHSCMGIYSSAGLGSRTCTPKHV